MKAAVLSSRPLICWACRRQRAAKRKTMKTVSIPTDKHLYVLKTNDHYWLTTLATNKNDCFALAKPYCKTDDIKTELKKDGFECVKIRLVEET
jgi:hypothetical protein